MKIEIYQKELLKGAEIALKLTGGNSGLGDLTVLAENNTISLIGYDGSYKSVYKVDDPNKITVIQPGKIQVSSISITSLVKGFCDSVLSIELFDKGEILIKSTDENVKTKVKMKSFSNYIEDNLTDIIQDIDNVKIDMPCNVLDNMLTGTMYAYSRDPQRHFLQGIFIHKEAGSTDINLVACDGHRIAIDVYPDGSTDKDLEIKKTIPASMMNAVKSILPKEGMCSFMLNSDKVCKFKVDNIELYSPLVMGDFVAYGRVIPEDNDKRVVVNKHDIIRAINNVKNGYTASSATKNERCVVFTLKGDTLNLGVKDVSEIQVEDVVSVENEGSFEIITGFNYNYVIEAAASTPNDNVVLLLNEADSRPLVLYGTESEFPKSIISPMRV